MDPRVKTSSEALHQQFMLADEAYKGRQLAMARFGRIQALRATIAATIPRVIEGKAKTLHDLDARAAALAGLQRRGRGGAAAPAGDQRSFSQLQNDYAGIFGVLEEADMPPTAQVQAALQATAVAAKSTEAEWEKLQKDIINIIGHE